MTFETTQKGSVQNGEKSSENQKSSAAAALQFVIKRCFRLLHAYLLFAANIEVFQPAWTSEAFLCFVGKLDPKISYRTIGGFWSVMKPSQINWIFVLFEYCDLQSTQHKNQNMHRDGLSLTTYADRLIWFVLRYAIFISIQ